MLLHTIKNILHKRSNRDIFTITEDHYGMNDTERCIEIPWSMSCYNGAKRVLDIGYANAEERYLKEIFKLKIPELYGLDMVKRDIKGIIGCQGDIRKTSFENNFFDFIFCISTIEHIGMDNSIYFEDTEYSSYGDFEAIKEMARILKKNGEIVLTVPYGKFNDYKWFIHYDEQRWRDLIKQSKCKVVYEDYFLYDEGWNKVDKNVLKNVLYKDNNAPAAAGLACCLLRK